MPRSDATRGLAPSADVQQALGRLDLALAGDEAPARADLRLLVKHTLALLATKAPGRSVEVRVPPFGAVQAVAGTRHGRGTPPAVVETDPLTWIAVARGREAFADAVESGRIIASGRRSDLSQLMPVLRDR